MRRITLIGALVFLASCTVLKSPDDIPGFDAAGRDARSDASDASSIDAGFDSGVDAGFDAGEDLRITSLTSPAGVERGASQTFVCNALAAVGADAAALSYEWTIDAAVQGGETTSQFTWTPTVEGEFVIGCRVSAGGDSVMSTSTVPVIVRFSDLIARYNFNGDANDSSGNGRHGTLTGGLFVRDRVTRPTSAIAFAAAVDRVTIPDDGGLIALELTVAMWIHPTADAGDRALISKQTPSGAVSGFALELFRATHPTSPNFLNYRQTTSIGPFEAVFSAAAIVPTPGTWTHIAFTFAVSGGIVSSYRDGVSQIGSMSTPTPLTNLEDLIIGSGRAGVFTGELDEVRIYGAALSEAEIMLLASSPL